MRVVIIEDEILAAQRLQLLLKQADPSIKVMAMLESIEESVEYLTQAPPPDLLLLDIQLSDGHSFEIFNRISYKGPVIFITAFDQYAIEAFRLFSIDYILKPISLESLQKAIAKFRAITDTFKAVDYSKVLPTISNTSSNYKSRFLARVGQRLFFVDIRDVAYFQADNKVVYLVDNTGNRYLIDYTLDKLESILDPKDFFRLNRKFIIKVSAIEQVKPYFNSRLKLTVKGVNAKEEMVVSRERVADFRSWAEA